MLLLFLIFEFYFGGWLTIEGPLVSLHTRQKRTEVSVPLFLIRYVQLANVTECIPQHSINYDSAAFTQLTTLYVNNSYYWTLFRPLQFFHKPLSRLHKEGVHFDASVNDIAGHSEKFDLSTSLPQTILNQMLD